MNLNFRKMPENPAKPFVKWAGGKGQLLPEIDRIIPERFKFSQFTYIEPFVGGGAVLFWILQKYPNIKKAVINDINKDLINAYLVIRDHVEELISILGKWEQEYHSLESAPEQKKEYYYAKRKLFNTRNADNITQAALFIFLNKTCYNGLYRVNRKGEFNVPIGSYKKPVICDEANLRAVSKLLQNVIILNGDFEQTIQYADRNTLTLFYCDPPYRPLSKTSSFNSYSSDVFDDEEQKRLARFCERVDRLGYYWILSNSDPKNINENDNFFDRLYENFKIKRVRAKRYINSKADKRGPIYELLITNYNYEQVEQIIKYDR